MGKFHVYVHYKWYKILRIKIKQMWKLLILHENGFSFFFSFLFFLFFFSLVSLQIFAIFLDWNRRIFATHILSLWIRQCLSYGRVKESSSCRLIQTWLKALQSECRIFIVWSSIYISTSIYSVSKFMLQLVKGNACFL